MATAKTTYVHTLILGGGITGLSTAYALENAGQHDYAVLEAQPHLGGLCATTHQDGYHFDFGGHVLHMHTPEGKKLLRTLLDNNLQAHSRHAFIYTNGMEVPYPFQQNLWAFHSELRELCVEELTHLEEPSTPPQNFEQWCLASFGHGLYEAFFRPYNEKLWGIPLSQLTCEWCGPFVPAPHRQEILQSARQKPQTPQGYNATFYYPKRGGIGALIDALATRVKNVRTNTALTRLDIARKIAHTNTGETFHFEHIVSTLPLPNFVNLLQGNTSLKQAAETLQAQAVSVYHVAIARAVAPFSWIYCPDRAQVFYRVGLQSSFDSSSVPGKDTSLFYIELPGLPPQTPQLEEQIWHGLHQKGLITQDDVKLFSTWQTIPHAYVLFTPQRAQAVAFLLSELEKQHVFCAGRYGRWEYSFMERSLLEAQQLAQKLAKLV